MIYNDALAGYDVPGCPAKRVTASGNGEQCLNCGSAWHVHSGWKCNHPAMAIGAPARMTFDRSEMFRQYRTQSMQDSLNKPAPTPALAFTPAHVAAQVDYSIKVPVQVTIHASPQPVDPSLDWRNWRSKRPGECPCGGVVGVCSYHPAPEQGEIPF